ncbi:MAG: ATP-binding cassette domain-containing protein [Planctomycetota bacterium]|nr:ATP-binding cassette domain-containing protein [Planctomycetota bacterium]
MIELHKLSVSRRGTVLAAIDQLVVHSGQKLMLTGGNGSGKTTLLRVIAGLEKDYAGQRKVETPPGKTTFLHQEPILFHGDVLSNLTYGLRARGIPAEQRLKRAREIAGQLQIGSLLEKGSRSLSGGEKKKIALARALVLNPALLLLDEPFADLDDRFTDRLVGLLLQSESVTVVVTSPKWESRFEIFDRFELQAPALENDSPG